MKERGKRVRLGEGDVMIEEDIKSNVITGFGGEMCPGANECRQPLNA